MTVLNFPASPSTGETYTENNIVYTWNGSYWEANNTTSLNDLYVEVKGDNMEGDLTLGTDKIRLDAADGSGTFAGGNVTLKLDNAGFQFDRDAASVLFVKNDSADRPSGLDLRIPNGSLGPNTSADQFYIRGGKVSDYLLQDFVITTEGSAYFSKDIQSTSQNSGPLAGFRNQLINGDFRVWQRGNGPFSKSAPADENLYTADRWCLSRDTTHNGTVTKQTNPANIPEGLVGAVKCSAGAEAFAQYIELQGFQMAPFAVGQTWTLSVWSTVDITTTSPFLSFRNTADTKIGEATTTNFIQTSDPANNGYLRYSSQITINSAPSDVGTDLNSALLAIRSHRGDNLNVDIRYSGIQLEIGPVATPFEHRPIGTELALCQRYYQVGGTGLLLTQNSSRMKGGGFTFATRMRANPTVTMQNSTESFTFCYDTSGVGSFPDVTNEPALLETGTFARADGMARTVLEVTTLSNFPQGRMYMIHTDWLHFDAEL